MKPDIKEKFQANMSNMNFGNQKLIENIIIETWTYRHILYSNQIVKILLLKNDEYREEIE